MGYSLSWLGIKGKSPEKVRSEMKLRVSGTFEEVPESDITCITVGDWYVIIGQGEWSVTLSEVDMKRLSTGSELVFCNVHEGVMFSTAEAWCDGRQVWSVYHKSEKGIEHLDETGSFPDEYAGVRERLMGQQKTGDNSRIVDYMFDIPVEIARAVTGFRHDLVLDDRERPYEVLIADAHVAAQSMSGEKKSWFKRLF